MRVRSFPPRFARTGMDGLAYSAAMTTSASTIQFRGDWRQEQHGVIERGSRLTLAYDKARLPGSFAQWRGAELGDILALCRFHPRGEIVSGSVVAPVRDREKDRKS